MPRVSTVLLTKLTAPSASLTTTAPRRQSGTSRSSTKPAVTSAQTTSAAGEHGEPAPDQPGQRPGQHGGQQQRSPQRQANRDQRRNRSSPRVVLHWEPPSDES